MNDEEKWLSKKKRVAFLLKDQPQKEGNWNDDARNWMNEEILKKTFFRKMANILFGLSHSSESEDAQWWYDGEIDNHTNDVNNFFMQEPFAYIECKKQPGKPFIEDKVLSKYLNKYKYLLQEELEIINPNIIVCMGGPIFDFVLKTYGATEKNLVAEKNVYYIRSLKKVILYAGHPADKGSYSNHYEGVMHWYRQFLRSEEYKDFCI
ncbi:MAG: hypothetical protein K5860_03795 [Bacteroidales bacterium]|nr:hypothetical protein [Bacteroidales bacterium]